MSKIFKWIPFFITLIPFKILSHFLKKEYYLFGTGTGLFHDNSKYLFLEFIKNKKPCYWVAKNKNVYAILKDKQLPVVRYNSLKHLLICCKAKVYFTTVEILDVFWHINKQTKFIQLWHGTPLKRINYDTIIDEARLDKKVKTFGFDHSFNRIDHFIIEDKIHLESFCSSFKLAANKFLPIGQPRNIILHENNLVTKATIKKKLQISEATKIILYCPTYRDEFEDNQSVINSLLEAKKLDTLDDTNIKIILKLHPFLTNGHFSRKINSFSDHNAILDLSTYDDIQELLLISDALITDYSSCAFDFSILKKPIYTFTPDKKKYIEKRGPFYNLSEIYFNKISTEISSLDEIKFQNKLESRHEYPTFSIQKIPLS